MHLEKQFHLSSFQWYFWDFIICLIPKKIIIIWFFGASRSNPFSQYFDSFNCDFCFTLLYCKYKKYNQYACQKRTCNWFSIYFAYHFFLLDAIFANQVSYQLSRIWKRSNGNAEKVFWVINWALKICLLPQIVQPLFLKLAYQSY